MHSYDTVHQLTCPSTSQQNGRAERKLRHILDTVCALLLSTKVPAPFWGEAALDVVHTICKRLNLSVGNKVEQVKIVSQMRICIDDCVVQFSGITK